MRIEKNVRLNWVLLLFNRLFVLIVPLVTTPYISRVIGAKGLGIYTYCLSYSSFYCVIGVSGIPLLGKREVAIARDDKSKLSQIFCDLMAIQTSCLLFVMVLYFVTAKIIKMYPMMFLACSFAITAKLLDISWVFEGLEEFKKVVLRNLLIKSLSVCAIFLFVKNKNDLYIYAICLMAANVLGNLTFWVTIPSLISFSKPIFANIKEYIKPLILLLLPTALTQLFEIIDKSMLGIMSASISQVAYYEQSSKIINLSITLVTAMGAVIMPRLAILFSDSKENEAKTYISKAIDVIFLVGMPMAVGIFVIAANLVPWFFGRDFISVIVLLKLFSPLVIFMGLNDLLATQVLVASGRSKSIIFINVIGIVINISLNAILIPVYGAGGATVATVITGIVKFAVVAFILRSLLDKKSICISALKYFTLAVIMGVAILLLEKNVFSTSNIISTLSLLVFGAGSYFLMLFVIKDSLVINTVDMIQRKIIR